MDHARGVSHLVGTGPHHPTSLRVPHRASHAVHGDPHHHRHGIDIDAHFHRHLPWLTPSHERSPAGRTSPSGTLAPRPISPLPPPAAWSIRTGKASQLRT